MPYLTPDSAPSGTICRMLVIPDDQNWKAIVNGALSELIYAHHFEQFGTATPDEVAAVFQQMFYDYLESECPVQLVYPGEIRVFAFTAVPSGWLRCEAQNLLRADYPDLFAAIGTSFGAADSTHFNLPQMQGRFAVGYWSGAGDYALGHMAGEAAVSLTVPNLPAHNHTGVVSPNNPVSNRAVVATGGAQTVRTAGTSDNTGDGTGHENRPPYTSLVYAIYTGV